MADDQTTPSYREWQVPAEATEESKRLGWLNEAVEEGQAWVKSQRGARDFHKALDTISGADTATSPGADYRSKLSPNRLKRNMREVIGALAKLRPMWGYHSDNSAFKDQAQMMNNVTRAWYLESFADRAVKSALQWAAATCRGWIRPVYRRDMYGTGRGDIKLLTYGSPSVLPVQLPSSNDWQSAYTVTFLDEMPVAMAHGMFPTFQARLRPTSSRYWYSSELTRKAAQGNWLSRAFGKTRTTKDTPLSDLLVPIRYSYIIDLTINKTGRKIPMGEPGSSWAYDVPSVGMDIPVGIDTKSGQMAYRKADENDARLYPYRRLIISSDNCITYDGPGFDWHGMMPGVSFSVDEWPWEPLGFSLVHDGYELNEAIKTIVRGNMDKVRAQLDPSLAYDTNAVSLSEARRYDPYLPKGRVGFDGSATEGNPFQLGVDPKVLEIDKSSMAFVDALQNMLDHQLGVSEAAALAKLRSSGAMDDIETIMEKVGPIIEDISRSMEPPMRDLGNMVKYLILQYYSTPRVMQYVGPDGIVPQVFDYDPSSLIPSHLPGESPDSGPSSHTSAQRARIFADNLRFFIMPNSLHEITQTVHKLGLIQLKKAGVMMDSQTVAEPWNIPDYGKIPGNTVIERFKAEKEQELEFMARMKELGEGLGLGAPPGAPKPGGGAPEGRPPSGNAPPSIKSKEGGARSTVSESK
jgi:hypothetical protein